MIKRIDLFPPPGGNVFFNGVRVSPDRAVSVPLSESDGLRAEGWRKSPPAEVSAAAETKALGDAADDLTPELVELVAEEEG